MYLAMEKVTFVKMVRGKNGNACGISEERKEKRKSMCLFGVYMLEVVYCFNAILLLGVLIICIGTVSTE